MESLQRLTELFKKHVTDAKNLTVWAENGVMFSSQAEQVDGFTVDYTAVVDMQDVAIQPKALFMHLVSWLNKYDPERLSKGLPFPTFATQLLDDGKCDIRLKIDFSEAFSLEEDVQGDWLQNDIRYRCVSDFEQIADLEELGGLVHFIGHQGDLPC